VGLLDELAAKLGILVEQRDAGAGLGSP